MFFQVVTSTEENVCMIKNRVNVKVNAGDPFAVPRLKLVLTLSKNCSV